MDNKLKEDTFCNTFKISLSFSKIALDIRQGIENNLMYFCLSTLMQVIFSLNMQC